MPGTILPPIGKVREYSGVQLACELLCAELLRPETQALWSQYLSEHIRNQPPTISYRALSRAITATEHRRYGTNEDPGRYKDRVRRAVLGQRLTIDTIKLFAQTFNFAPGATKEIITALQSQEPIQISRPRHQRNYRVTNCFYDVYLDHQLRPNQLNGSLIIQAKEKNISELWAPKTENLSSITLLSGGSSDWVESEQAYRFTLEKPLRQGEFTHLSYTTETVGDNRSENTLTLRYYLPHQSGHVRLFFDDPKAAPAALDIERASFEENPPQNLLTRFKVPVYNRQRASLYLNKIYREKIIFRNVL